MSDGPLITIYFLGDISLNDNYIKLYERGERPFEEIGKILAKSDLVVGNLECFSESEQGENLLKRPRLKTKLETLNYLKDINLGLVSLANNHFYDNLEEGFQKTINFLTSHNINYIGSSLCGNEEIPFIFEKNGIRVAILNYVSNDTNPNLPDDAIVKPNWFYLKKVEKDIAKFRNEVDYIVVYPHWGGRMEGAILPDRELIPIAHKIIDAGADLIIGHHSHTIQPFEVYKGKYIFYSLGNFCFSDHKFEDKESYLDRKRNFNGLIILAQFSKESIFINPYKISSIDNRIVTIQTTVKPSNLGDNLLLNKLWGPYLFYEKKIYPVLSFLFHRGKSPISQIKNMSFDKILKYIGFSKI